MAQQAYTTNARGIQDAQLVTNSTMAANSAVTNTANGSMIDLGVLTLHPTNEKLTVRVSVPAMADFVNTIGFQNVALIDGTENVGANGTEIAALAPIAINGVASTGTNATSRDYVLPGITRRFLGLRVTSGANTQNQMAKVATLTILA